MDVGRDTCVIETGDDVALRASFVERNPDECSPAVKLTGRVVT
jgi:hypothetical protein